MAEIDEIRMMNNKDLHEELDSSQFELMNLRFRASTLQLTNFNEVKLARRKIARIMTVMREREISEGLV
jgi:large subunit ribosomal protein L29